MQEPIKIYYFISRFLDSDIPTVTTNFKEFLVKDGIIEMLIMFITQNFPQDIKDEIKQHQLKQQEEHNNTINNTIENGADSNINEPSSSSPSPSIEVLTNRNNKIDTSVVLMKSYRVMNLFLHPSPPFISLVKDKLPVIISSLFEIFESDNLDGSVIKTLPNIYHFSKVLSSLFYQYTFEFLNQLSEFDSKTQKIYFQILVENIHHIPIQDLFIIIAKRASASVNEYQTSNPIETKKIQKTLQKSKVFNIISSFFTLQQLPFIENNNNNNTNNATTQTQQTTIQIQQKSPPPTITKEKQLLIMEGITEFIIKCIEQLDIHGPDVGFTISSFQNKEFLDTIIKLLLNAESSLSTKRKGNDSLIHRKQCLSIILSFCKQSKEYSIKNRFQQEKDSIFSPSGTPSSWVLYLSTNHLSNVCKILVDIGNDPNQKQHLGSFRIDMLSLLIDLIKAKSTFKRKQPNQAYLSVELWYFLIDWFFQFNNIYHSKFFSLLRELFHQQHLPSIKHFCTCHLSRFILFYMSNDDESECRGVVLLILNYIRIISTQFQSNHYLVTFLKSNEQWNTLQSVLISDTLKQYTPNFVGDNSMDLIGYGSEFAESIGINEDENGIAKQSNKKLFLVDEFQTGNGIEHSQPTISAEEIAKIEKELLKDDANKKKKKNNKNNQKKKK